MKITAAQSFSTTLQVIDSNIKKTHKCESINTVSQHNCQKLPYNFSSLTCSYIYTISFHEINNIYNWL